MTATLVWVTISILPFASPWPSVPTKQLALLLGAVVLFFGMIAGRPARFFGAVLAGAPMPVLLALSAAWGWIFWLALSVCALPSSDYYEALWGNSARGAGVFSRAALVCIATVVAVHPDLRGSRAWVRASRVSIGLVALYSTLQSFGIDAVKWDTDASYLGSFGNMNQAGSFYAFAIVVLLALLLHRPQWKRRDWTFWFDVTALLWMIGLCGRVTRASSRQGLFLVVCVLVLFGLGMLLHRWKTMTTSAHRRVILLLVTLVASGGMGAVWLVRVDNGAQDRFAMWSTAARMAFANPVRGVGVEQVPYHWNAYSTAWDVHSAVYRQIDQVHSGPLQQADEAGLPAFGAYIAFMLLMLPLAMVALAGARPVERAAAAGWLVFALQDTYSPFSTVISLWGWVCAGALLSSALAGTVNARESVSPGSGTLRRRWFSLLVTASVTGAAIVGLSQRIWSEFELTRAWNVGRLNDGSEAQIRRRVQVLGALSELERIVERRPNDPELRGQVAMVLAKNGEVQRSARVALDGLTRKPTAQHLRDIVGELHLTHGDAKIALAQYDTATRQFPRSVRFALFRRVAAEATGDSIAVVHASAHVDSLGTLFQIPADSMRVLQRHIDEGLSMLARRWSPRQ